MIKYIGIRGHRGSGKNSISYLIAQTIQYLVHNHHFDQEDFHEAYLRWCTDIKEDEFEALNELDAPDVYLESFGDTPKILVEFITNIPHDYIYSDYYKDHTLIDLSTFDYRVDSNPENWSNLKVWTADTLLNHIDLLGNFVEGYMTLRDFIVYFATVNSRYLGRDLWVKCMKSNERRDQELSMIPSHRTQYRIFTDLKAPTEVSYIKERQGKVIKLERPGHQKENTGVELLGSDTRVDYLIINKDGIESLESMILAISRELL